MERKKRNESKFEEAGYFFDNFSPLSLFIFMSKATLPPIIFIISIISIIWLEIVLSRFSFFFPFYIKCLTVIL